jgi:hypothetical protein
MTRIAVLLMTCDRPAYTRRTLETFLAHNPDRSRFVLLHGDDASIAPDNLELAAAAGFRTVIRNTGRRRGILALRTALIDAAAPLTKWALVLENDLESRRPFPWALFDHVRYQSKFYALRLFGAFKDADQAEPCKTVHQWTGRDVRWASLEGAPEPAEVADVHWSAQPTVTRTKALVALHHHHSRTLGLTARVVDNVMVHIGATRTRELAEVAC